MSDQPRYERPSIVRHQMGGLNKFGQDPRSRLLTEIDGAPIDRLLAEYGSPLFVFSERTLVERYQELEQAFLHRYPRVRIAWSYKTNYLQAICRVFHRQGAWAEVVSPFEYDKAIQAGIPPERIHFNGPFKPDDALARAIDGGSFLHVDGFDEIARIERIAKRLGKTARLAIRVNMSVEGVPAWSRFGLNLESGQAAEAAARIAGGEAMDLVGLHTHIGTFMLDPASYKTAASKLARFANTLAAKHRVRLSFIDMGGGFASRNTLKDQYLDGGQANPRPSQYAQAISEGLAELEYPAQHLPTLVLETGRALVDEAGSLVTTVQSTKRLGDGRRALVLDAGANLLFTAFWYRHDVVLGQEARGLAEPTVLYGPLCMNIDVLRDSVSLPPLARGDRLIFQNVGAYNVTQWMQFITLRPAVVMVGRDGRAAIIRRAETVDDINGFEAMPEWLR